MHPAQTPSNASWLLEELMQMTATSEEYVMEMQLSLVSQQNLPT